MIKAVDILDQDNLDLAMEHLTKKKDSCGIDNIRISEFKTYWETNKSVLIGQFLDGSYEPEIILEKEIVGYNGKRRMISMLTCTDRFFLRAFSQILQPYCENLFQDCSHAYRNGRGVETAVRAAADYIAQGMTWVAELDIEHFFDSIPIVRMEQTVNFFVGLDASVHQIMEKYLRCRIENDGKIVTKQVGLVQGSPLSPILSNLYLTILDQQLLDQGYAVVRYGDDIRIFTKTDREAEEAMAYAVQILQVLELTINKNKSGVYRSLNRRFLGYVFEEGKKGTVIAKRWKNVNRQYHNWHTSSLQRVDKNYHLINNGILSKQDFSLVFENDDGKVHLPIETTDAVNVYADVTLNANVLKQLTNRRLRLTYFDKYGNCLGYFLSAKYNSGGKTMLQQAALYINEEERLSLAKRLEIAAMHNLRANLRYYQKHNNGAYQSAIKTFSGIIQNMNEAKTVNELMLLEGRARQIYYRMFNEIIGNPEFYFEQRSKRPPKDPINAMISFGNVYLYNRFATEIHKTSLDIRIGLLHSTSSRSETLNLDLAELFKPIIVDRAIFTLINKKMIRAKEHFEMTDHGGVYLNRMGKRLFLEEIEKKLYQTIQYHGQKRTYEYLIREEVQKVLRLMLHAESYKPYKYTT